MGLKTGDLDLQGQICHEGLNVVGISVKVITFAPF